MVESDVLTDTPDNTKRILALAHKLGPPSPSAVDAYNTLLKGELTDKLKDLQQTAPGTIIVGVAARLAPEVGNYTMSQADVNLLAGLIGDDLTALNVPGNFKIDTGITYVGKGGDIQPGDLASFIFEGDRQCTFVAEG